MNSQVVKEIEKGSWDATQKRIKSTFELLEKNYGECDFEGAQVLLLAVLQDILLVVTRIESRMREDDK